MKARPARENHDPAWRQEVRARSYRIYLRHDPGEIQRDRAKKQLLRPAYPVAVGIKGM